MLFDYLLVPSPLSGFIEQKASGFALEAKFVLVNNVPHQQYWEKIAYLFCKSGTKCK